MWEVPISDTLATLLAQHRLAYPGGPADNVFPDTFQPAPPSIVRPCRRGCTTVDGTRAGARSETSGFMIFATRSASTRRNRACHPAAAEADGACDPAHDDSLHAARAESYIAEDGARIGASLSGERNREVEAQARLVRDTLRPA